MLLLKTNKETVKGSGLQPCSWRATILKISAPTPIKTPEPANQGVQGYLIITDRCVAAGLDLKPAGQ